MISDTHVNIEKIEWRKRCAASILHSWARPIPERPIFKENDMSTYVRPAVSALTTVASVTGAFAVAIAPAVIQAVLLTR